MFGDLAIRFLQWDSVKNIDVIGMAEHHEHFMKVQNSRIARLSVL